METERIEELEKDILETSQELEVEQTEEKYPNKFIAKLVIFIIIGIAIGGIADFAGSGGAGISSTGLTGPFGGANGILGGIAGGVLGAVIAFTGNKNKINKDIKESIENESIS